MESDSALDVVSPVGLAHTAGTAKPNISTSIARLFYAKDNSIEK